MHSRGFYHFFKRGWFLLGKRDWSHLVELVFVPMFCISKGLRDMVNVGGAVISHVGIFLIILWFSRAWSYIHIFSLGLSHRSTLVIYCSIRLLYTLGIFHSCFEVRLYDGLYLLYQCISRQNHLQQVNIKLGVWFIAIIQGCGWL